MLLEKNTVEINGEKFAYWTNNAPKKTVIILIHGFPGNHNGLTDMAGGLEDYKLILPDLPASGESGEIKEVYSSENFAHWLNNFLDSASVGSAVIVGHSFGGRVGLVFAGLYPKKVERLILITPPVKVTGPVAIVGSMYYKIVNKFPESFRPGFYRNRLFRSIGDLFIFVSAGPKRRRELQEKNYRELDHLVPRAHKEIFNELYNQDLTSIGKKVTAKTLLIGADKDGLAEPKTIKALSQNIKNSEYIEIKNAGHIVVLEEPLKTAKIIKDWLEKDSL